MAGDHSNAEQSFQGPLSRTRIGGLRGQLSTLMGKSLSIRATGRYLQKQYWIWPILAAVVFGVTGWFVHASVEHAMQENRQAMLKTILDADVAALRVWMDDQRRTAELLSFDETLAPLARDLVQVAAASEANLSRELLQSPALAKLRERLAERLKQTDFVGFYLVSPASVIVASDLDAPVGQVLDGYRKEFFDNVRGGASSVSKPFRSQFLLVDETGRARPDLPTMFAAAAIRDESDKPIAALGLRIRPEDQFTKILQVARSGETGETYAFDRKGLLLSQSRFDEHLKQVGLLVDQPEVRSILVVEVRDPQVNMVEGERPKLRRSEQPLTQMAASAVTGAGGVDPNGYRDYRGVPVIGAWTWLDDYDFGVTTEVDVAEAFQPLYVLRRAIRGLIGVLLLAALVTFVAMFYMARQQRDLQRVVLAAKKLGQYTLEKKLGSGGMGTVYKAHHAMLRRPTAVKLLDVEKMSDMAMTRFEREVQLTSQLTHPNTIAVYDFGRTPENICYYAMEYLEGTNLNDLVGVIGALSEARTTFLLRQICGSLAEAHGLGMVHRDVKPANIFLTNRGGLYDFVKVLDFGLAKSVDAGDVQLTSANAVTGTPLYMSPEAINRPDQIDARSDVYAIGAVAYFLLTGSPMFEGTSVVDVCMMQVNRVPDPPSVRLGKPISRSLESLIMRCLAKSPAERPSDAAAVLVELDTCAVEGQWTCFDAALWWATNSPSNAVTQSDVRPVGATSTKNSAATDSTMAFEQS